MKVSREAFDITDRILDTFDPERLKAKQMDNIDKRQIDLEAKLKELEKPVP